MKKENFNMKKCFAIGITAMVITTASSVSVAAQQDFTLVNQTGYELSHVYVSPSDDKNWDKDILGKATMPDGESGTITFSSENNVCSYDIKVVYSVDQSEVYWTDIDLCKHERITIHWDQDRKVSTATFE